MKEENDETQGNTSPSSESKKNNTDPVEEFIDDGVHFEEKKKKVNNTEDAFFQKNSPIAQDLDDDLKENEI